ncbi:MAG TPA: hypothetical protein VKG91_16505 [Roseiarcus sp.]|nr:hypothetical protein [Roseiarcus sp.]
MSNRGLTRRTTLSALAGLALAPASALAQPAVRLRGIQVDVGPLRANAGDPTAAWVEEALPGLLEHALGAYVEPGYRNGAVLTARIDFVYLGPSSGGTGPLAQSQDTIGGVLIVHGPRGTVPAETPLRAISNYYPMAVDQPLAVQSNHDRIVALAQAFAFWTPRELGL